MSLDGLITVILRLLSIALQIGIPCLAAYVLSRVVLAGKKEPSRKQARLAFAACLLLVFGALAVLFYHPIVTCPAELEGQFTEEMRTEAVALNRGFGLFPFFAAKIAVKDIQENGEVTVEVLYLFIGARMEMAFGNPDGPEILRPLY